MKEKYFWELKTCFRVIVSNFFVYKMLWLCNDGDVPVNKKILPKINEAPVKFDSKKIT